MSIDTRITLPHNVRARDVASVLGALLGLKATRHDLGNNAYATHVEGATVESTSMPECAWIRLEVTLAQFDRAFLYHFEGPGGTRLISMPADAAHRALGRAIVDFFGGSVDDSDADEEQLDYVVPAKSDDDNCPSDGAPWHRLQDRILAIRPLRRGRSKQHSENDKKGTK
jgi:hypothetical protein